MMDDCAQSCDCPTCRSVKRFARAYWKSVHAEMLAEIRSALPGGLEEGKVPASLQTETGNE